MTKYVGKNFTVKFQANAEKTAKNLKEDTLCRTL